MQSLLLIPVDRATLELSPLKIRCFEVLFVLFCTFYSSAAPAYAQCTSNCDIAEQALASASQIKAGTTRSYIEKSFQVDGGASFRFDTVYVYKKCNYLKITVHFVHTGSQTVSPSPDDVVESVSEMTVGYENRD